MQISLYSRLVRDALNSSSNGTDIDTDKGGPNLWLLLPFVVLFLATCMLNLAVMTTVRFNRKLMTVVNVYVFSLAITDFMVGCVVNIGLMVHTMYGYWPLGEVLCDIWVIIDFSCTTISMMHMCLIAADRYVLVKKPKRNRLLKRNTSRRAIWRSVVSWVVGTLVWAPVIGYEHISHGLVSNTDQCLLLPDFIATLVQCCVVYYPALIIIFFCYIRIIHKLVIQKPVSSVEEASSPSRASTPARRMGVDHGVEMAETIRQAVREPAVLQDVGQEEEDENYLTIEYSRDRSLSLVSEPVTTSLTTDSGSCGPPSSAASHVQDSSLLEYHPDEEGVSSVSRRVSEQPIDESTHSGDKPAFVIPKIVVAASTVDTVPTTVKTMVPLDSSKLLPNLLVIPAIDSQRNPARPSTGLSETSHPQPRPKPNQLAPIERPEVRAVSDQPVTRAGARPKPPASKDEAKSAAKMLKRRRRVQTRATQSLAMAMLAFIICWLPYSIIWPLETYCSCVPSEIFLATYWLAYINSTINPLMYFLCNTDFRQGFIKMIRMRMSSSSAAHSS